MQMRPSAAAALADVAQSIAAMDQLSGAHGETGKMSVEGTDAVAVVDHYRAAIAVHLIGEFNHTVRRCDHPGSDLTRNIYAAMKSPFPTEGVDALAEGTGDASFHRPKSWCGGQADPVPGGGVMQLAHAADAHRCRSVHCGHAQSIKLLYRCGSRVIFFEREIR